MPIKRIKHQQGFTLFISMVFMVILTIIGLSSIQNTRTELSMSGNLRESDKAFQSAEMGLHSAETMLEDTLSKADFDNTNGLIHNLTPDPDYFDIAQWTGVNSSTATLADVFAPPQFIIKYLGDRAQNQAAMVNIGDYTSQQPGKIVSNFRVTSRGYGQTEHAITMLQTYYGKE